MDVEAIQAITQSQDGVKQQIEIANQAIIAMQQAKLEQTFELGLQRAGEVSAQNFQASNESGRVVAEAARENTGHVANATEIEMRPSSSSENMGESFENYIEDFQSRTREYPKEINALVGDRKDTSESPAAGAENTDISGDVERNKKLLPEDALMLMEKGLWFRTETELVSTVSRNATRTINDLMKGQ